MKVKELMAMLSNCPQDLDVVIKHITKNKKVGKEATRKTFADPKRIDVGMYISRFSGLVTGEVHLETTGE